MKTVLIVGLERSARQRLLSLVERYGLDATAVGPVAEAKDRLEKQSFSGVWIDCAADGGSGLQALALLPLSEEQQVVFLSDDTDGSLAKAIVAADLPMIEMVAREPGAAELERLCRRIKQLGKRQQTKPKRFESMLGNCPQMLEVYNVIAKVAPSDASVLICGDAGRARSWSRTRSTSAATARTTISSR